MQEVLINVPDIAVSVGKVALGVAIGAVGTAKLWWAKKSKEQKISFLKDLNEKAKDGKVTVKEVIELAEVHM